MGCQLQAMEGKKNTKIGWDGRFVVRFLIYKESRIIFSPHSSEVVDILNCYFICENCHDTSL